MVVLETFKRFEISENEILESRESNFKISKSNLSIKVVLAIIVIIRFKFFSFLMNYASKKNNMTFKRFKIVILTFF